MWDFLKRQTANVPMLKSAVNTLVEMTMQKDAGQQGKGVPFEALEMVKWTIICEATCLVLSGELDSTLAVRNDSIEECCDAIKTMAEANGSTLCADDVIAMLKSMMEVKEC